LSSKHLANEHPDPSKCNPDTRTKSGEIHPPRFPAPSVPCLTSSGSNTYLLGTGRRRILIDTGEGTEKYSSLLSSVLNSENCTIGPVLITHWHYDHVGGIPQLNAVSPGATFSKFPHESDDGELSPIHDGDVFTVEGAQVKAIHTPGHTTDHVAFFMEDDGGILFSGDSILGQGTAVFENLTTYIASLRKQLFLKPKTIFPGHGPVIADATAKIQEYISHRQQREDEIIQVFQTAGPRKELLPGDIVKVIYARYPQSLWPAAERGVVLHLEKLRDEGKANSIAAGKWILILQESSL
jgi:endoribonuclease LACTB2